MPWEFFWQMAWLTDVVANVDRFVGLHEHRVDFRGKNDLDASVAVQTAGIRRDNSDDYGRRGGIDGLKRYLYKKGG